MSAIERGLYWDAVRLAAEGSAQFLDKAREAKIEIANAFYELWYQTNVLDNLVAQLAPDAEWTNGVSSEGRDAMGKVIGSSPTDFIKERPKRVDKILAIVGALTAEEGVDTIRTTDVVGALRQDGYDGKPRDLAVAVGNVLTRTGEWQRVRPGEYVKVVV